jgi:hypothetical protein
MEKHTLSRIKHTVLTTMEMNDGGFDLLTLVRRKIWPETGEGVKNMTCLRQGLYKEDTAVRIKGLNTDFTMKAIKRWGSLVAAFVYQLLVKSDGDWYCPTLLALQRYPVTRIRLIPASAGL